MCVTSSVVSALTALSCQQETEVRHLVVHSDGVCVGRIRKAGRVCDLRREHLCWVCASWDAALAAMAVADSDSASKALM